MTFSVSKKAERKKTTTHNAARRDNIWGWLFTAPFAIIFTLFLIVPLTYAFYISLGRIFFRVCELRTRLS